MTRTPASRSRESRRRRSALLARDEIEPRSRSRAEIEPRSRSLESEHASDEARSDEARSDEARSDEARSDEARSDGTDSGRLSIVRRRLRSRRSSSSSMMMTAPEVVPRAHLGGMLAWGWRRGERERSSDKGWSAGDSREVWVRRAWVGGEEVPSTGEGEGEGAPLPVGRVGRTARHAGRLWQPRRGRGARTLGALPLHVPYAYVSAVDRHDALRGEGRGRGWVRGMSGGMGGKEVRGGWGCSGRRGV